MTLDISAIRQRIEKATPGEWVVHSGSKYHAVRRKLDGQYVTEFYGRAIVYTLANAELIAHAPADLRALCDEVERLRKYAQHTPICQERRFTLKEGSDGGIAVAAYKLEPNWKCSCGLEGK